MSVLQVDLDHIATFPLRAQFEAPPGVTVLFGPSGAGKTTLLDCIAGLRQLRSGLIRLGDRVFFDSERHVDLPPESRKIGYVFQNLALFPHLTARQNVAFGAVSPQSATAWMHRLQIDHRASSYPAQLSGGEKQRLALARAMASEPAALLLDEPFSALDQQVKFALIDEVRTALAGLPIPVLFVTHDVLEGLAMGDHVVCLERGAVVSRGQVSEVLSDARRLLADRLLHAEVRKESES